MEEHAPNQPEPRPSQPVPEDTRLSERESIQLPADHGAVERARELAAWAYDWLPPGSQVYLFGSRSRGNSHGQSDLDLGILVPQTAPHALYDWAQEQTDYSCGHEHVTVLGPGDLRSSEHNQKLADAISSGVLLLEVPTELPSGGHTGMDRPDTKELPDENLSLEDAQQAFYQRWAKVSRLPQGYRYNLSSLREQVEAAQQQPGGLTPPKLRYLHKLIDRYEDRFNFHQRIVLDAGDQGNWRGRGEPGKGEIEFFRRKDSSRVWQTSELGGAYNTTAVMVDWLHDVMTIDYQTILSHHRDGETQFAYAGHHWLIATTYPGTIFGIPCQVTLQNRGHENGINDSYEFHFASKSDSDRFEQALRDYAKQQRTGQSNT